MLRICFILRRVTSGFLYGTELDAVILGKLYQKWKEIGAGNPNFYCLWAVS